MSEPAESWIARIESDVQHIKADTADLRVELRRTNDRIDELRDALTTKMDVIRDDLTGRIDGLKEKLHSLTIWALLLYFTLAGGLLTVIARAFEWI